MNTNKDKLRINKRRIKINGNMYNTEIRREQMTKRFTIILTILILLLIARISII